MRFAERLAAGAVVAMTAPAFLVFPILGLWYVTRVWPGMSLVDRTIFCWALVVFFASVPIGFGRCIRRAKRGHNEGMTTTDRVLMYTPILAGGWALTHRVDTLLVMSVWGLWNIYRAHKRQRETSRPQAVSL